MAAYKKSKGLPVKDKNREAKVIEKVAGFLENKEYSVAVKNIMRGIIDQACLLEETALSEANDKTYEVACFGPAGSFTHQALEEYFHGRQYNRHHFQTFEEVISGISDGTMDYAVLPIENSCLLYTSQRWQLSADMIHVLYSVPYLLSKRWLRGRCGIYF